MRLDMSDQARQLLLHATELLAESLDYQGCLAKLAELAVPTFADWCTIDVRQNEGKVQRVAAAYAGHRPGRFEQRSRDNPPAPGAAPGITKVLDAGEAELYPQVPDELLQRIAHDETHLSCLRNLRLNAVMLLPLTAGGQTLGVMTLGTAESGRPYTQTDLHLAQRFARHAALAISNAKRHTEVTMQFERHMEIQHAVTKILAETKVLYDAKGAMINAICDATGFNFGEFWNAMPAEDLLQLRGRWAPNGQVPEGFRALTTLAKGEGLVGNVWASVQAQWLERLDETESFGRREAAEAASVKTGFAFPVCSNEGIIGVMAFYSHQVRREDGSLLRLVSALGTQIGDFVARKRAEQELRIGEERYRSLVEASAAIVWTSSATGEAVTEQPGWTAFTGVEFERLKGWGWLETVHPDDRQLARETWREALSKKQIYKVEERLRRHDGVYRHMMVRAVPVFGEHGRIREWVGVHTDITHLKEAERQKARYAQQLQGLTEAALLMNSRRSSQELLQIVTDKAREIIGAHQAVIGIPHDESWERSSNAVSLSDKYAEYRTYDDTPDGSGIYRLVLGMNQPFRMTQAELEAHPAWRNFGKERHRHPPMRGWLAAPINDRQGNAIGLIQLSDKYDGEFNASDEAILVQLAQMASAAIENARLFNEVQQPAADLEQRVEERTTELAATNRELEAFSYSVSHDLRAPLRSIDGFSQALLEDYRDKFDATAERYLERIRSSTQRMGLLIDDLLDLSRLSRSEMHFAQVNLTRITHEILAALRQRESERDTSFIVAEGMMVEGDERLLTILLENLLENAWKFTSRRAQTRIEVGKTIENGRTIYYVRDNGAGFDQRYADKLFGAFQRLHTIAEFEGAGIGLATVQRIVHRHGGRVWAHGQVDHGATFYFTLTESPTGQTTAPKDNHA